jgi:signal transduction histidine kinase
MRDDRGVELGIALLPVALTIVTLIILLDPRLAPATVNQPLDLLINATATLVALAVAVLGWVHFREGNDSAALVRASAFLVLAAQNALLIAVTALGIERAFGLSLADPGQLPLWSVIIGRGVAAALLVVAGFAALRRWPADRWPPALVLALPALVVTAVIVVAAAAQPLLPQLLDSTAVSALQRNPVEPLLATSGIELIALQAAIGIGFLAAAALSYRLYRRDRRRTDAYLAIGLILAAFSQLHAAIHPGSYASLVTTGDILRVAFYALLLTALAAESRGDLRAVREANAQLVLLRDADVARATADERARLAREIHDGMSQELWLARLKQGRLLQEPDLSEAVRSLAGEVSGAIEAALAEARQAIVALRPSEEGTFAEVIERYVADFGDRFGIRTECICDATGDRLGFGAQAELLRITQEALANARKHADPTRVRVQVEPIPAGLRLTVTDNGSGFEPSAGGSTGYGLRSMRERADAIGASLTVESEPQGGTRVVVDVPLESPNR